MGYKDHRAEDKTPIQQAMLPDSASKVPYTHTKPVLGVVLEVYPSDHENNRSAIMKNDRCGYLHECSVLLVLGDRTRTTILENVIIPPSSPSGVDDYEERLPRPTSMTMSGVPYDESLQFVDPYDLDGDWCVVQFLNGNHSRPYVANWWPSAANTQDPATSGRGEDGDALEQHRRYFKRVNGVETVVTSTGDVILSTTFANSKVLSGEKSSRGRIARKTNTDDGGSVRLYVKPSQSFEVTFAKQKDGIGAFDKVDEELPQPNPPDGVVMPPGAASASSVTATKDVITVYTPDSQEFTSDSGIYWEAAVEAEMKVGSTLNVIVGGNTTIETGGVLELEGSTIKVGEGATDPIIKGNALQAWIMGFQVASPFGPLTALAPYAITLLAATGSSKGFVE